MFSKSPDDTMAQQAVEYVRNHCVKEDDVQKRLRQESVEKIGMMARMISTPEQMQFLQLLIKLIGAKKVLEVGTFTGYGSLCFARALPDDGHVITLDINDTYVSIGKKFWKEAGYDKKIESRIAPALESLQQLISEEGNVGQFDLIFIDADKIDQKQYVEKAYVLLKQNGLIVIDNTLFRGTVFNDEYQDEGVVAVRELNKFLYEDNRWDQSLTTIGDGLTFLRKL